MMRFVYLVVALTTLAFAPNVNGGSTGKVGSIAVFEFHNADSELEILASAEVEGTLDEEDVEEMLTSFDASKNTKILIHGWNNGDESDIATLLIEAYLPAYDYNVFFVDWSAESYDTYPRAVQAVPKIGKLVAEFVDVLVANYSASLDQIHIIGHSLGAHVAGIAGLYVESGSVSRITGLDPAKPLWSLTDTDRLSSESATFVDVIHTCSNYLSFINPLGHVDFYPNGGVAVQPGCFLGDIIAGKCSHGRAYQFFAESITNPENFPAVQCDSWNSSWTDCDDSTTTDVVYMGENVSTSAEGYYYLTTNKASPYGLGSDS